MSVEWKFTFSQENGQAPANLPQLKKTLSPVQIALENKGME